MSTAMIQRDDGRLTISFTPEAQALKESALECGALIGRVSNADEQEAAVKAQLELRRLLKLIEDARKSAKEPVIDFGRKIDRTAAEFKAELDQEHLRITQLVADFQALEQARVRAAEAARQKELDELERKRQEELSNAKSHEDMDKINERANQEAAAVRVVAPARVEGQIVREDWDIQITDVWLLARSHPGCIKIEPRMSEIRQLLDAGIKVAGVSAKKIVKAGVRLKPERIAIAVA